MPARPKGTNHSFTLIVDGPIDDDSVLNALFEAGCDDATFGSIDGVGLADFNRGARTFLEAVRSAVRAVESVPSLRVVRVEPEDLVTMAEMARRLDRSREGVRLLIAGERGPGAFPAPVSRVRSRSPLWRWADVAAWAHEALGHHNTDAALVASINAALELRRQRPRLAPRERNFVASLSG
ncbi:MAG: hypothetical protein WD186_02690 [Actinomycetota bacterium]